MRIRYGLSPWIDAVPDPRRPAFTRLRGQETADVVIVGGGLTGCATAYALAMAGQCPLLVEGGRIGQAGAGRSAGLLLPVPGPAFRDLVQMHGLRTSRTIFDAWRRATLDATAVLRRAGIRCRLEPFDSVTVAAPDGERALRREYDAREAAGLDAAWVSQKALRQMTKLDTPAGMRASPAFGLDPYSACIGLARAAVKRGARIFERSRVAKVLATSKGVEVVLDGGVVHGSTVIVATGAATAEFKPLRRHFKRRESYLVMTEPIPAAVRKQLVDEGVTLEDARTPRHRIRWTHDQRLIVGGADQDEAAPKHREAVLVQRTGQLMYELLMMYPAISGLRPEYGWELPYGETADGLMYVGPHRNYPHHLFALGGRGDSITGAFLAARILTRAAQGQSQKGDDVFGWTR
jgi:glycine/D-amino acid oxidase-like deaminating enzyme